MDGLDGDGHHAADKSDFCRPHPHPGGRARQCGDCRRGRKSSRCLAHFGRPFGGHALCRGRGAELSIADIPIGYACFRYYTLDIAHPEMPHLMAWYERLQGRDGFRQHVMIALS